MDLNLCLLLPPTESSELLCKKIIIAALVADVPERWWKCLHSVLIERARRPELLEAAVTTYYVCRPFEIRLAKVCFAHV